MSILEKEVWIGLNTKNVKHFESLGYDIPKVKRNWGITVPQGTKILVKIDDLQKGSNIKLTKICDECGDIVPNQKFQKIVSCRENTDGKDRCRKCSYKRNRKENPPNNKTLEYYALTNNKEYLLIEFSNKNSKSPKNIYHGTHDIYLWDCPTCKNEYTMSVIERKKRKHDICPFCTGRRVLKGFNDLWTTHPHIAHLLKCKQRGYEISFGSVLKEDFICENCGFEKNMIVSNVVKSGFACPKCSDGISYPEKFVYEFLEQLNVHFKFQHTFDWSENIPHINPKLSGTKRYDFYIPNRNMIIETHGEQHINPTRGKFSNRTLEEEQDNDRSKMLLAKEHDIEIFVVLDCSKSELEHIKRNIMLSCLSTLFDLEHIDWLKCHEFACHSLVKTASDLWNQGNRVIEICDLLKLSNVTITKYLKQGKILGWNDYDSKKSNKLGRTIAAKKHSKEIVQLTLDGQFIKYWDSAVQVNNTLGINRGQISSVCKGKRGVKQAGGFKWMYKEDYESTLK